MDDYQHLCPVCKANGNTMFLQLRQINLTTAVYLCKDIRCSYPLGHTWIYVDRNLLDDNESDSDSSNDSVSDDIERMTIATQQGSSFNAISDPKYVDSTNTSDFDRILATKGKSPKKQTQITEPIILPSNIDLNLNVETSNTKADDPNEDNIVLDKNSQLAISEQGSYEDVTIFNYDSEIEDVIIDDPDEILSAPILPIMNATNLKPIVIASGVPDSEIVDASAVIDVPMESSNVKYNLVRNNKEPNKFKLDIRMIDKKQENLSTEEIQTNISEDLETFKKSPEKLSNSVNLITGKVGNVNNLKIGNVIKIKPGSNIIQGKIIRVPDLSKVINVSNTVLNIDALRNDHMYCLPKSDLDMPNRVNINSEDTQKNINMNTVKKKQKLDDLEKQNANISELCGGIQNREKTDTIGKVDKECHNINESNSEETRFEDSHTEEVAKVVKVVKPKRRKKDIELILPYVEDFHTEIQVKKPNFNSIFQSKLKLQSKKQAIRTFQFSEATVQEALQTAKELDSENKPQEKQSLVKSICGLPNIVREKDPASNFAGYRYASKVRVNTNLEENCRTQGTSTRQEPKTRQERNMNRSLNQQALEAKQVNSAEILNGDSNVNSDSNIDNVSSKNETNDTTNLGLGDLTINELFHNIDDLGAVNMPNNSADIAEVDDWLSSLCQ